MNNPQVKELLPEFLTSFPEGRENDVISAFKLFPKFLQWLERTHHLKLLEPQKACEHRFEIIEKFYTTRLSGWDGHEIKQYNVIQRCEECGHLKKSSL